MTTINRLLRKNTSAARVAGFVLSNFIGMAIVLGAMQFWLDAGPIWSDEESFISSDYLVVSKTVTGRNTIGASDSGFSEEEIADLERQPWVRETGRFLANDFKVYASVGAGGASLSTYMFFEAIPDRFVDVPDWNIKGRGKSEEGRGKREEGRVTEWDEVPIIIPKDYLALYNFGFAGSAGLPQMSEGLMSGIPLTLTLTDESGTRVRRLTGHVAGYSNRLNTILVPRAFLEEANRELGQGRGRRPSRLIVDVSSPGDVAITEYLEAHGLEVAGDKSSSQASFLLRLVVGIVMAIGAVITVLSLFILLLSVSLLMEKNREKLHTLLMLGYRLESVARPYEGLVAVSAVSAYLLALVTVWLLRLHYLAPLRGMGAGQGALWPMVATGLFLTVCIIGANVLSIRRRVVGSFHLSRV